MATDWNGIREDYISCTDTMKEFAKRHPEISISTLRKHCASGGWEDERKQFGNDKAKSVREANLSEAVRKAAKIDLLWDLATDKIEQALRDDDHPTASALEHYTNAIAKAQEGMGVEDELKTELRKAQIEKLRRDAQRPEDDKPSGVVFEFPPELEEDAP